MTELFLTYCGYFASVALGVFAGTAAYNALSKHEKYRCITSISLNESESVVMVTFKDGFVGCQPYAHNPPEKESES